MAQYCCSGISLEQALQKADVVTIGKVVAVETFPYQRRTVIMYTVRQERVYKGDTTAALIDVYYLAKKQTSYNKDSSYLFVAIERTNNIADGLLNLPEHFLYIHPCSGIPDTNSLQQLDLHLPDVKKLF